MINRVLDLQSLTVRQAMEPFPQDGRVTTDTPVSEVLAIVRQTQAIRLPVWEKRDNRQRIAGLINANALLFDSNLDPNRRVGSYLQPALFVDEDMRVEVALR